MKNWFKALCSNMNSEARIPMTPTQELDFVPQVLDVTDLREVLPRNKTGKKWKKRKSSDVLGVCIHHTGGGDDPTKTNAYHIGPNHISDSGMPRISYTYFVDQTGEIFLCNDLEDITWSQGRSDKTHPGDENRHLVSVCFGGNFKGSGSRGTEDPTVEQCSALHSLWLYLKEIYNLEDNCIFGHYHFGKAACPGYYLQHEIEDIRGLYKGRQLTTPRKWQKALKLLGTNIKVDGKWGPKSRAALQAYQRKQNLRVTAVQDPFTELWLLRQLRKERKISKV